jgi:hypothetical protein
MPNKQQERFYLDALRQAMPNLAVGQATPSETPDFLLSSHGRTIGIEFTLIHLPPSAGERPHQETQALKDRIVARAAKLHDDANGPALYVTVFFRPRAALNKGLVDQAAQGIARAVSSVAGSAVAHGVNEEPRWQTLPQEVVHISIQRSINGIDKLWHADAGGWVAEILPEHIREVVATKVRMHSAARQRCDELWLVIVNDVFSRAAQAELGASITQAVFEHPFDRLLVLVPHALRVIALSSPAA